MDAVRNIVFIAVLISVCDGTYFFKHKKHILPPIHHFPHAHPHPHPHPHPHFHHHPHPHGVEEHGPFHKFHGFKHVKTIIYPKILPLPKPVMYKTFLMRKYSLPPNFHVHIPLNKKMYGHAHGPFKPHTHYADKPMYLKKRKMKKIFKPKLPYSGGYGKYPVGKGLSYGTRGKIPRMPGSIMQPQTNMFLPTGILPPSTFVPSKKPGINKYELWLRKINEWMLRNKNIAKGVPQNVNNRRVVNTIHNNVPFAVQKPIIQKPRTRKQNNGIIANFVVVKPPFVRKSEEPAGLGIPVSEKPKTLITNSILETPKLQNMELQPTAPVVGIPINLDNIGPPFDINVIGDQGQSALPPPIDIVNDPAPGTVGGGDMIDVGLPIDLTPESFGPHPATPPNILVDGIPKEPTLNSIVPLPGNLNELLTDVADLSHFPKLDLSNEPLIIEPVGPVPPARLPLDIQPFPWDPSEIPFPPEVIPRSSNKEKEPYVMKPLEPIIKIIGRDRVKRKNETIFVPKPALNDTEPSYIIKDSSAESDTISTTVPQTQPTTTTARYRTTTLSLPPLPVMEIREFEHLAVSPEPTTTTPQSTESPLPPSSDVPLPDPGILFNGTKGDGQHNLDMVDQIIEREQTNDTAFFKYKPHEYNISFPYLILHGPNSGQSPKGSQFETKPTTPKTIITTTPEKTKTTPGVRLFTTTIPTPVINNQVNEEIVLDFMADKYPQSSRADVVLDYSTPDRDTTTQTQQGFSPKTTSSTSGLTTTTDQVTSTTATPTTTRILTSLKPTTTTTIRTTSTTAEATTSLPATTAKIPSTPELAEMIVAATSTTQSPTTQPTPSTTTEDYYVETETPVYDYVTHPYEWLDNVTFVYEDISNTTQQTTQTMAETTTTTTTTLINEPSEETPTTTQSSPILESLEFSSKPTTSMMESKSTKQTTTPESETQTTQTTTTMTTTTQQQEQSPSTTISSTVTPSTPGIKTTASTEGPSTTEGPKICQQTYCKIGYECTEKSTWLCPRDEPEANCQCSQGCRVGQMFIPLGESYYLDDCGSFCSCFNLYGKAECQKLTCVNKTADDPVGKPSNYTGISIGGVIYIPVQRVRIPNKNKETPSDDGFTYGISIGGVIYIPKRNHTNNPLDKNSDWTSGISLGGVIYVPSREHTNGQDGHSNNENMIDGNSSWTKGISIGGIIYVPVHKRKKTFQEKNKEFEKIYDKTMFADAGVITVESPYGTTRGITIGGVIYIPKQKNTESVQFLGEVQPNSKDAKNETSPVKVEYPLGWSSGISIGGIIYVPVRQRKQVQENPVYKIPEVKTEPDKKNGTPYLTRTSGIHIGGIINVPVAKRSSVKSLKIKKMDPAFG